MWQVKKYLYCRDPLFSTFVSFIMRKNFQHRENINIQLMWFDALGLRNVKSSLVRNEGIWAPDSGPCGNATQAGGECRLSPEASHDYVRIQVPFLFTLNFRINILIHLCNYISSMALIQDTRTPLGIQHLGSALYFYALGVGLSVIAFAVENINYRCAGTLFLQLRGLRE